MSAAVSGDAALAGGGSGGRPLGVGVIGLGFIGREHLRAWDAAARDGLPVRLAAVCDTDPERRAGRGEARHGAGAGPAVDGGAAGGAAPLFDPARVTGHARPDQLLSDPAVDVVSICTYTDSHVELALAALDSGKHVLVEKPVALQAGPVARLLAAARDAHSRHGLHCMPAMCMRFWPGWDWLLLALADRRFGAPRRAEFHRRGAAPSWATGFYGDLGRSGGALFDLHVHDADFVRAAFGAPLAVDSRGDLRGLATRYRFQPGGPEVRAGAAWLDEPSARFSMGFAVDFDHATIDWELGREPLLRGRHRGAELRVTLPPGTGYDGEVRHLCAWISPRPGAPPPPPSPLSLLEDAVSVTATLQAERESLSLGRQVPL